MRWIDTEEGAQVLDRLVERLMKIDEQEEELEYAVLGSQSSLLKLQIEREALKAELLRLLKEDKKS